MILRAIHWAETLTRTIEAVMELRLRKVVCRWQFS